MGHDKPLMVEFYITPEGEARATGTAEAPAEKALLAAQGTGPLLRELGTTALTAELPALGAWLRQWARRFFARLCQVKDAQAVDAPAYVDAVAYATACPPGRGGEYLTPEAVLAWWEALRATLSAEIAATPGGLTEWLASHAPMWRQVGRVTFHLAENKASPEFPFAFLATFSDDVSTSGRATHWPLAKALQRYARAQDQPALDALLAPVKAAALRSELVRGWLETRQLFQPLAWTPREAYAFLREVPVLEEAGILVKVPDWWKDGRPPRVVAEAKIEPRSGSSLGAAALLKFDVQVVLESGVLTPEELEAVRQAETGLVSLRGQWVEVDRERLSAVLAHFEAVARAHEAAGLNFTQAMRWLAGLPPTAKTAEETLPEETRSWGLVRAGEALQDWLKKLRDPRPIPVPHGLRATLRPYQEKGFAWLRRLQRLGLGACLADDMGLGKTLQVLALLQAMREANELPRAALLIAPASLLANWRKEAAKFTPELRVRVAHPSAASREEMSVWETAAGSLVSECDVVLTTYTLLPRLPALTEIEWPLAILDEAQAIKNAVTQQTRAVKKLTAASRIALTGTPVENRPEDLWSLFDFLNPRLLGTAAQFAELIKRLQEQKRGFAPLRQLTAPFILRRLKTDKAIIADLPEKEEVIAYCGLTRRQSVLYTRLVEELKRVLFEEELTPIERQGRVLSFLQQFKQVCNHPSQWSGDGTWAPEDSGKFLRLQEIAAELAERQDRVLVFTQFQELCSPLADSLAEVFGRRGLILHGGTPVKKRATLVEEFQQPDGPPYFVISVKAGGTGLNLTAANHVIHFDRWWNPAVENQATDRAYRIGQRRHVLVHKFVTTGTIEERIEALLQEKQALADELLDTGAARVLTEMNDEELLRFVSLDPAATLWST